VTVTQAGTYAYVTPVLAILVGGLLGNETITVWIVGGMACILVGVGLLRTGGVRAPVSRSSGATLAPGVPGVRASIATLEHGQASGGR
jgi:drug/metabolite transporter (DMT)-like permease